MKNLLIILLSFFVFSCSSKIAEKKFIGLVKDVYVTTDFNEINQINIQTDKAFLSLTIAINDSCFIYDNGNNQYVVWLIK